MSNRLARSAGLIGLATLASRILGLARDVIQGSYFGTLAAADAFGVASRMPALLRDLFAEGAMSAAFVPTFTRHLRREGQAAAFRLASQVINGLILVTVVLVVAGIVLAQPLVGYYASGFADTPEKLQLTVTLTRLCLPFLILVAVAAACMGILNGLHRFFVPALSPALYNVMFIVTTIVLTPAFIQRGVEPALALGLGMLVGGVAQVAVQWPALRAAGYRHQWVLNPRDRGLREILLLMGPGSIGAAAAQVNLMVNTSLATAQDGAPSALQYAFRLMYMPIGIFSVSVATAVLPDLARHAADHDRERMRSTLSWALRLMLMLSVPATAGLMVLAHPIVELIFQRGHFDARSTALVASALICYAPGIVGYSVVKIVSPTFYALQDARTPIVTSLAAVVVNLVLNLSLNAAMGFQGLALGTAIAANVNAALLLLLIARRTDGVEAKRVMVSLVKIAAASVLMAGAAWWTERQLHVWFATPTLVARLVRVLGGIGAGVGTLALAAWVLHIEEFRQALGRIGVILKR
ncbi:MAG: murein biosynthesis integral membrane protein MurJ [Vicinamibacterales bacterium]